MDDDAENIAEDTYQRYKDEPDKAVERKRGVIRSLIVSRQDVEYNEARMKGLNRVVHESQRKKRRREGWDEIRDWVGVLIAILVGLGAALLSAWKVVAAWLGF
jgi:hypothetical protein